MGTITQKSNWLQLQLLSNVTEYDYNYFGILSNVIDYNYNYSKCNHDYFCNYITHTLVYVFVW